VLPLRTSLQPHAAAACSLMHFSRGTTPEMARPFCLGGLGPHPSEAKARCNESQILYPNLTLTLLIGHRRHCYSCFNLQGCHLKSTAESQSSACSLYSRSQSQDKHLLSEPAISTVIGSRGFSYFLLLLRPKAAHNMYRHKKHQKLKCKIHKKIRNNNNNNDRLTAFDPGQPG